MNDLVVQDQPRPRMEIVPVAEIQQRMSAIKSLIQGVMKEGTDFGVIPGTGDRAKKVLWKPGAEKICAMFRIAVQYDTQDLSRQPFPGEPRVAHYRVVARGVSSSGEVLGEGMGEASTEEEKYRWRRAVCDEEYDNTPETQRRIQYKRSGQGHYTTKQVMTNAADSANTILKMAAKRAHVAMVLSVTGCSDDFSQDVIDEDTPTVPGSDDAPPAGPRAPRAKPPAGPKPPAEVGLGERKWIENKVRETGANLEELLADAGIESLVDLTPESFAKIKAALA